MAGRGHCVFRCAGEHGVWLEGGRHGGEGGAEGGVDLGNGATEDHVETDSAEEVVEILDIPVVKSGRGRKPRVSAENAEVILENVLEALPEPKAAGQGRGRSRRVSTANISTGEDHDASLGEA